MNHGENILLPLEIQRGMEGVPSYSTADEYMPEPLSPGDEAKNREGSQSNGEETACLCHNLFLT